MIRNEIYKKIKLKDQEAKLLIDEHFIMALKIEK
jgi:hypothetical protein